ncbi:hypothetical protein HK105_201324 [Polyrhizophydium stewartii]|uniref:EF-hand domain-containing protein n=1 Tax=Polyrhizophydium stewartii TaxID=2732419 RepID=A0ABR4NHW9_9FUNG
MPAVSAAEAAMHVVWALHVVVAYTYLFSTALTLPPALWRSLVPDMYASLMLGCSSDLPAPSVYAQDEMDGRCDMTLANLTLFLGRMGIAVSAQGSVSTGLPTLPLASAALRTLAPTTTPAGLTAAAASVAATAARNTGLAWVLPGMAQLSEAEAEMLFARLDVTGNGRVSWGELTFPLLGDGRWAIEVYMDSRRQALMAGGSPADAAAFGLQRRQILVDVV